ncbi:glucuronate isomerase [Agromyces hippuratus]|uniref:Uronate isomerase n=1 Tax=Agromyces hippuratus TaxID=286438 RepID=A0A852WXS6_9MICO|nr:glucuronate isomerase [Agromyces hippuratus]NYG22427.1 glucuronate isomerase [Agromyces hippuratus]
MTHATADAQLEHSPERVLPADPRTRGIARELLHEAEALPILSPHGHVPAELVEADLAFGDPATLLVTPDHYVTRLLHADGVPYGELGRGDSPADPRSVWRRFCERWPIFDGTASGLWLRHELATLFDVTVEPSAANADALYARLSSRLAEPAFRPRALLRGFGIELLATTDDPLDDLAAHAALAERADVPTRVVPTFRPDAYTSAAPGFTDRVDRLTAASGTGADHAGYLEALRTQRARFIRHGALSADHGVRTAQTLRLDTDEAARLFDRVRRADAVESDRAAFEAHMLYESARMSVEDGLVMTIHPGVHRDHHPATRRAFGPDTGHDIPFALGFTRELQPLLEDFGTADGFHLVLYTIDETTYSRELAPLAGFYPSVYLGSPWWFLDAPDAMLRFRRATVETAGFSRTAGFVDDTRALCSIPARHDVARRIDAGFLADLVAEERMSLPAARRAIRTLTDEAPRRVFKL